VSPWKWLLVQPAAPAATEETEPASFLAALGNTRKWGISRLSLAHLEAMRGFT
jgi:hypothetical protein